MAKYNNIKEKIVYKYPNVAPNISIMVLENKNINE